MSGPKFFWTSISFIALIVGLILLARLVDDRAIVGSPVSALLQLGVLRNLLREYAADHNGTYPERLDQPSLSDGVVQHEQYGFFHDPNRINKTKWIYFRGGHRTEGPSKIIVAMPYPTKAPDAKLRRAVLYSDLTSSIIEESEYLKETGIAERTQK